MQLLPTRTTTNGAPATNGHTPMKDGLPLARTKLSHSIEHIHAATEPLPTPACIAVRQLHIYGREHNLSLADLGQLIGYDASTVSKLFNGKYRAENYTDITTAITTALASAANGQSGNNGPTGTVIPVIAETSVVNEIAELCLLAWTKRRIVFIFGPTQCGKTAGIRHFARAHSAHPYAGRDRNARAGAVKIIDTPANGGARGLLNNLAIACHVSPQSSWEDLKLRTFNQVGHDDLIIIDEFSQCFDPVSGTVKVRTVRLAREIWNHCQCGMVVVMTDIAKDEMQKSRFVKICNELWFRRAAELQLERLPSDADLKLIAQAHGLPSPGREELKTARTLLLTGGMTQFTTLLEMAGDAAHPDKPTWPHFEAVKDTIQNYARVQTKPA